MDYQVSIVIPTRNEEAIIEENLKSIYNFMKNLKNISDFEIIIADNSTDATPQIVKKISKEMNKIQYHFVKKRGIGAGLQKGIDQVKFDLILLYDIDMAWKLDTIPNLINEIILGYDIVYASRYVKKAKINRPLKRRVFSFGYRVLTRILFGITIKDWNSNRIIRKSSIMKFRDELKDDTGFFHTELAICGKKHNLKMKEIAAEVNDLRNNSNQIVFKIAWGVLKSSLKKKFHDYLQKV